MAKMKHGTYLKLAEARTVNPANDPEGPTIQAPVLKILTYDPLDEIHEIPHVSIRYAFGFVNSKAEFKILEPLVHTEIVANIVPYQRDGKTLVIGQNPITHQDERAGMWLDELLAVSPEQKQRVTGDFRVDDLYRHLVNKLDLTGGLVYVDL